MTGTLREQVVQAIRDPIMLFIEGEFGMIATVESDQLADLLADAVIRVVPAAVAEQIEALPYWQPGICGQQVEAYRVDVLAVVARLGEAEAS